MLDDLAATVENLRSLLQALGHAIEPGLVFEVGNGARPVRASGADRAVTTGSSIAVIDFGEIAQPAVADRRQHLPGRADISVAFRVVSETRPCGRSPRAPRSPRCGPGTCGMQPAFSQASMSSALKQPRSATTSIVSTSRNLAGRFCGLRQKPHVDDRVGPRRLDDQLGLRVDGDLDVIADAALGMPSHGAAVGIGQSGPRRFVRAGPASLDNGRASRRAPRSSARLLVRAPPLVAPSSTSLWSSRSRSSFNRPSAARINACNEERVKLRSLLLTALMRVPSTASSSRP